MCRKLFLLGNNLSLVAKTLTSITNAHIIGRQGNIRSPHLWHPTKKIDVSLHGLVIKFSCPLPPRISHDCLIVPKVLQAHSDLGHNLINIVQVL